MAEKQWDTHCLVSINFFYKKVGGVVEDGTAKKKNTSLVYC